MEEKLVQILERFQSRADNAIWDLTLTPDGENIHIVMKTNDAYRRGRDGILDVRVERTIKVDEDDFITEPFSDFQQKMFYGGRG